MTKLKRKNRRAEKSGDQVESREIGPTESNILCRTSGQIVILYGTSALGQCENNEKMTHKPRKMKV